jgi:hypothetical protein
MSKEREIAEALWETFYARSGSMFAEKQSSCPEVREMILAAHTEIIRRHLLSEVPQHAPQSEPEAHESLSSVLEVIECFQAWKSSGYGYGGSEHARLLFAMGDMNRWYSAQSAQPQKVAPQTESEAVRLLRRAQVFIVSRYPRCLPTPYNDWNDDVEAFLSRPAGPDWRMLAKNLRDKIKAEITDKFELENGVLIDACDLVFFDGIRNEFMAIRDALEAEKGGA